MADKTDQELLFCPDFLQIPVQIVVEPGLQPLDGYVYAVVYWLEHLKDGRCWASNAAIGEVIGATAGSVSNSLARLSRSGFIACVYDEKKHRKEIKTLVYYSVHPTSNDGGGVHQMMDRANNIELERTYTSETLTDITIVYRVWLLYMIVDPDTRIDCTEDERRAAILQASKSCRLTDKRKKAIAVRLADAGRPMICKAIKNLSQSDFHRNSTEDSKWTASLEWICKNYEQVETWANK